MRMGQPLILLVSLFSTVWSYKMAVFVLDLSNSQLLFNERVAEALADAGHDVTMILISPQSDRDNSDIKIKSNVKVHVVNAPITLTRKEMEEKQMEFVFKELSGIRMISRFTKQISLITDTCEATLKNKEFLEWLKTQKFDLAYAHMFDVCTVGLIHAAKIPSWIWLSSGALLDYMAYLIGVPTIPSYVPPVMMAAVGEMDFMERTKSLVGHLIMNFMWKRIIANPETELFRTNLSPDFPDLLELAAKCPLVMLNTNELYDIPRPLLAKVVSIGGIGMEIKDIKPLSKDIQHIVDTGEGNVIFSFGSVTAAQNMPYEWKKAFLEAFKRFPNYQFLCRYEKDDLKGILSSKEILGCTSSLVESLRQTTSLTLSFKTPSFFVDSEQISSLLWHIKSHFSTYPDVSQYALIRIAMLPPNVHLYKWLPQSDLLRNAKTRAFITHGGFNSIQEAINAAVPVIVLPLFGDQPKNALLAKHHGFGLVLQKSELSVETISDALEKIISDTRYATAAKRLSKMANNKPVSADHLLVKWSEFVAEFKTLENLEPAGNKLNFVQYYSLDVICFLLCILLFVVVLTVLLLRFSLRAIVAALRSSKAKSD